MFISSTRYLLNGKESETYFGAGNQLFDYGARMYDPVLCRWISIDPMLQFSSPYVFSANCPTAFVDPDGQWAVLIGMAVGALINGAVAYINGGMLLVQ